MDPDRKRLYFTLASAALAGLLALAWLWSEEQRLLHQGEETRVLVAKRYLPANTRLEASQVAWMAVPRAFAPTGTINDASAVLGMQTLVPFSEHEPLIFNKLAVGDQSLAASVPEGKRAISLSVNAVTGISGLLKAGDHADVLLLHGQGAQAQAGLLLQDVPVLAVGTALTRAEASRADSAGTVTLALTPQDAALALAASANGQLHLILRASNDSRPAATVHAAFADALRRLDRPAAAPEAAAETPDVPHKR